MTAVIFFYESRSIEQDKFMTRDRDDLIQGPKVFLKESTGVLGESGRITQATKITCVTPRQKWVYR
jgi:hypothetical protein